jgi:hypothetical protein
MCKSDGNLLCGAVVRKVQKGKVQKGKDNRRGTTRAPRGKEGAARNWEIHTEFRLLHTPS